MARRIARFATIVVATTGLLGLVGVQAAHATALLTVSPSTNLSDGQAVTITLNGVVPGPLNTLQVAECGNAYGNGSPLITVVQNAVNCETLTFVLAGQLTIDPLVFLNVPIKQTGIGTGNRSCVSMVTASIPCVVYVSTAVNQPTFPSVNVSFAADIPSPEPAETTTTISPIGSPIGADKVAHANVHVVENANAGMRPEGSVDVIEGITVLGTSQLVNGDANVALGTLLPGPHDLVAHFTGNGSFAASDSASATLDVIDANNVAIGDASVIEGDSGIRAVVFPVVLSKPSATDLTVNFSVAPSGSAPAALGTDLVNNPKKLIGKLKFKALKQTVHYIKVQTLGDTVPESDKTFSVTLAPPGSGFALRRQVGTGTIIDDDTSPPTGTIVSVGDSAVPEGDVGSTRMLSLAVTLSQPVTTGITTVYIQVSSTTALHGKKGVGDWSGAILRKVKLKPGVLSVPVSVAVFPDGIDELDEQVAVKITSVSAVGTTVTTSTLHGTGTGTILTDE